jgi:hypothetical protein
MSAGAASVLLTSTAGADVPIGPDQMPGRLLRSSSGPWALVLAEAPDRRVRLYSITAFALLHLLETGQRAAAVAFLDWCAAHPPLNCIRVLCMCHNMFRLTPQAGLAYLPEACELAGARGLYVEAVAIADTHAEDEHDAMYPLYPGFDYAAHVAEAGAICADFPNTVLEFVNEPMQKWQPFDPATLRSFAPGVPREVPFTLGAPDGAEDESQIYCDPGNAYQTVHSDRNRAPWGNVRHTREIQIMSSEIDQYGWNDEPGKQFTCAQHFAIGGLAGVCMIGDTFHADGVRHCVIPTGDELAWFEARRDGWAFVPATTWGTFANFGWTAPNPEPPIAACEFWDEDGRAYSVVLEDEAYTVLINARYPVWKPGWTCRAAEERTDRPDRQIETGLYHLMR